MKITITDPTLIGDLVDALGRWHWPVAERGRDYVLVDIPAGVPKDAAQLELALFIQVWLARHPDVEAVADRII